MTPRKTLLTLAAFAAMTSLSSAGQAGGTGAPATQANRIVGMWTTVGHVSPCDSGLPPGTVMNTLLFNAGGTATENAPINPGGELDLFGIPGLHQRNNGLAVWSYDSATKTYTFHLRFDWLVDGDYNGYQTVDRLLVMSGDGAQVSGPVRSTRYALDGSVIIALCGDATSTRIY
jgi:hypothetical protein